MSRILFYSEATAPEGRSHEKSRYPRALLTRGAWLHGFAGANQPPSAAISARRQTFAFFEKPGLLYFGTAKADQGRHTTADALVVQCQDVVYAPKMTNRDGSRML